MTMHRRAALLEVRDLAKAFPLRADRAPGALLRAPPRVVHALNGVSFTVRRGETLGIVGESGCGKSTLARCLVRLIEADAGTIRYDGIDVRALAGAERRAFNRRVQMIFQDPYSSLNPRMTVRQTLAEALARPPSAAAGGEIPDRIAELLALVRLPRDALERYPHEFSGGQRQRIGIARALAVEPECLIADELVSALDVSVQAQVINLLLELQERLQPDRPVRRARSAPGPPHLAPGRGHVSRRGSSSSAGPSACSGRRAIPTRRRCSARRPSSTRPGARATAAVRGELPSPLAIPAGCPFHPRCPHVFEACRSLRPELDQCRDGGQVACHLATAPTPPTTL